MGSPGYYSRVISFVTTRVAQATIALAGAYLLAAPAAYGAAPGRVVVPPVFPLALVQQVTLPSMPLGAPAVGAGLAVVALAEGDVVAFDLATGTETWRAQLEATHRAVVAGDAVYVVTADTTECLALADGAVRWRTPRAHAATTAPFVTDQSVIIATAEPGVTALVRATGTVSWTRVLSHPITQPFVGATGRVFGISARPEVTALDAATGAVLWSLAFNATLSGLAESANRVYVGSDDNFFYALNAASGRIDWKWRTGADVVGAAALDDEHVYFVSLDNLLRALDRRSGGQRWKRALPTRSVAGPLLIDGVLLVVGYSPELRGHLPATGAPVGRYGTDGEIAFQPTLASGAWPGADRLVVVTLDRVLAVLRRRFDTPVAPLDALPGAVVTVSDPPAPPLPTPPALP